MALRTDPAPAAPAAAPLAPVARPAIRWRALAAPLAVALVLRLLLLLLIRYRYDQGDAAWYSLVADNIREHGTMSGEATPPFLPSTFRAPLYPAFIAGVRAVVGDRFLVVQLLQALLGTISVGLMGAAAGRGSKRMGRWAIWVLALSPFDASMAGTMLSESLVIFFLSCALAAPFLLRTRWRWAIVGLCLGLAALTRDVYMLLIPGLALAAAVSLLRGRPIRSRAVAFASIVICGTLVIAPWTARNYVVKHQFIPISRSVFARSLWQGTWVVDNYHARNDALGLAREYPPWAFRLPGERATFDKWASSFGTTTDKDAERDHAFMEMFKRRVAAEPGRVALVYVRRAPLVWVGTSRFDIHEFRPRVLERGRPLYLAAKVFLFGLNAAGVALGFLGVAICAMKRDWKMSWFALPIVYSVAVFMPLDLFEPRYTQPVYACTLIMACFAMRHLRVAWLRRRAAARR